MPGCIQVLHRKYNIIDQSYKRPSFEKNSKPFVKGSEMQWICRSTYGGGATKALAGSLFLDNCQVANNTANAGAGTEIAGAAGYYTVVGIRNSIISGNTAALQGGAFNLGSTNATTFSNVTFQSNIGRILQYPAFMFRCQAVLCDNHAPKQSPNMAAISTTIH